MKSEVTTEGDCEGRSTRKLGIFTGFIDEIALYLADKCAYKLYFKAVKPQGGNFIPTKKSVQINIEIPYEIQTSDLETQKKYYEDVFKERDVKIIGVHGYGTCTIETGKKTIEERKEEILNKLSDEERQILGFK